LVVSPDADLQDRLGYRLLKRRGYGEFMAGKIDRTEFGKRLAQEWASLPVLAAATVGKRKVARGQSYYAGDGLNKALVGPERVEAMLDKVKAEKAETKPTAKPEDAPLTKSKRLWTCQPILELRDVLMRSRRLNRRSCADNVPTGQSPRSVQGTFTLGN
jgi:hypothetical protein